MKKKVSVAILMAIIFVIATPVSAFAGSKPYKDVSKKSVGKAAYTAICYIKKHEGYKDVADGKKFHPKWKMTKGEFIIILTNFYGDKVPVTEADKQKWSKKATPKWATKKMVAVAEKFGMSIIWEDKSTKAMSRALASRYIYNFATFDPAFRPVK